MAANNRVADAAAAVALQKSNLKKLTRELFLLVSKRPDSVCNFLEGGRCVGCACGAGTRPCCVFTVGLLISFVSTSSWGSDTRIIYRHYATLYFIFVVDQQESELGILDLVQGSLRGGGGGRHRNKGLACSGWPWV